MQNKLNYTFPVPHNVFEEEKFRKYRASIKLAYVWLLKLHNRFANKEGWFWRSGETLSKEIGMDIKTYWSAKNQLVKDGYIQVRKGEYNPEKNARHAFWYKVNGFLNSGEKIPVIQEENQQGKFVQPVQSFISKNDLEKKYDNGGEIYDWLVESDCLARITETTGYIDMEDGRLTNTIFKKYPDICNDLKEFLIWTQFNSMYPPKDGNTTPE